MLKFLKIQAKKIIYASITCLFFSSCQFQGIKGSGIVTSENRLIDTNFKSIEVEKGIDAVIEQSKMAGITVVADDNIQKHIITNVKNEVLTITSDNSRYYNVKSKKVIIKMPIIEEIQTSSGASLLSKNVLKGNAISFNSSSGSRIEVGIETEKAFCKSSSGSQIIVKGKTIQLETSSSSGSSIDTKKLLSNDILADASSGSSITVYPLNSLNAKASSGGSIIYFNNPKKTTKKTSSGGNIDKE